MRTGRVTLWRASVFTVVLCWSAASVTLAQTAGSSAPADDYKPNPVPGGTQAAADEAFAVHAQTTFVYQGHAGFHSGISGPNSLSADATARETWDATLYLGVRLWKGAELWLNPEVDQGFGMNNTLGVAGFPSGEAYKIGAVKPYFRVQRIFFRQTLELPGEVEKLDAAANQLAETSSANRVVFTGGKLSVGDIFDTNKYAHDPRGDFLNWSVIDAGTFDYAADAWGYSAGVALEWYQGRWTFRGGGFLLSDVPNSERIDTRFSQFQMIGEVEERHSLFGQPGNIKALAFVSRGRMARLDDAVNLARADGQAPDLAAVRRYASRSGVSLNLEQQLDPDLGLFARVGWADGAYEAYEFTDIDRSCSGGLSLGGKRWGREDDTVTLAGVINQASQARLRFLNAGGLGILIGDGRLPRPGTERIVETYYDLAVAKPAHLALDYQWVTNPGYNRDRGPVSVLAVRLHGQF